jgi:hypothetical protein
LNISFVVGKTSKLGDIIVGQIYDFIVEDSSSDGILGHIDNNVRGICEKEHIDGKYV